MNLVYPAHAADLIHCGKRLVFAPDLLARWADRAYFRISGVSGSLKWLDIGRQDIDFYKPVAQQTMQRFPRSWEAQYPFQHMQAWSGVGRNQVKAIQEYSNQTLDRALLSVVYLCEWVVSRYPGLHLLPSFLEPIKVVPILWVVSVTNNGEWDEAKGETFWSKCVQGTPLQRDLENALRPNAHRSQIVEEALRVKLPQNSGGGRSRRKVLDHGLRLTFRNANRIFLRLRSAGYQVRLHAGHDSIARACTFENLDISRKVPYKTLTTYLRSTGS